MKEKLRESLDVALKFQELIDIFRNALRDELEDHEQLNDELIMSMMIGFNGLGQVSVQLFNAIDVINDRINIYGNGEGIDKQMKATFTNEVDEDWGTEPDEWEVDDDETD